MAQLTPPSQQKGTAKRTYLNCGVVTTGQQDIGFIGQQARNVTYTPRQEWLKWAHDMNDKAKDDHRWTTADREALKQKLDDTLAQVFDTSKAFHPAKFDLGSDEGIDLSEDAEELFDSIKSRVRSEQARKTRARNVARKKWQEAQNAKETPGQLYESRWFRVIGLDMDKVTRGTAFWDCMDPSVAVEEVVVIDSSIPYAFLRLRVVEYNDWASQEESSRIPSPQWFTNGRKDNRQYTMEEHGAWYVTSQCGVWVAREDNARVSNDEVAQELAKRDKVEFHLIRKQPKIHGDVEHKVSATVAEVRENSAGRRRERRRLRDAEAKASSAEDMKKRMEMLRNRFGGGLR